MIALVLLLTLAVSAAAANVVDGGTRGSNLTWTLDNEGTLTIDGTGEMYDYGYSSIPWYFYRASIKSVVIGNGVTSISDYAFYDCSGLTSVAIPDSVTSIGHSAFFGCSNLKFVYITDLSAWCKIKFNDDDANPLYNEANLYINNVLGTDITIPNDITTIENYIFYGLGFTM